jgi:O-methyltransferase involved in polyketide biosynthesis
VETARELPGPFFLVAEASLVYLSPADAHRAISLIAEHFSGSQLAFDTCGGSSRSRTSTTCSRTSSG